MTAIAARALTYAVTLTDAMGVTLAAHRLSTPQGRAHLLAVLSPHLPAGPVDITAGLTPQGPSLNVTIDADRHPRRGERAIAATLDALMRPTDVDPFTLAPALAAALERLHADRHHPHALTPTEAAPALAAYLDATGHTWEDVVIEAFLRERGTTPSGYVMLDHLSERDAELDAYESANTRTTWIEFTPSLRRDYEDGYYMPLAVRSTPHGEEVLIFRHTLPNAHSTCHVCGLIPMEYDALETVCVTHP